MRLFFLDSQSRASINVTRLRKSGYDTRRIVVDWSRSLDGLVVLGDGTPDDKVLGVLSYHLDGDKIVGVVKPPEKTGLGVIDNLKTYLSLKIDKIMVLVDQEDLSLRDLFEEVSSRIEEAGVEMSVEEEGNRLRVYNCRLPGKEFEVMIVVNGLDEVRTEKHTIEDHLIRAGGIEAKGSSKSSWDSLSSSEREDVFKKLKGMREVIRELFPQQVAGCEHLRD